MKKIAIIGSGTGLTLAWLLHKHFDVTVFEKEDRVGGHINSLKIGEDVVEGGAEFINPTYRYFLALLEHLEIPIQTFQMSMRYRSPDEDILITLDPFKKFLHDTKYLDEDNIKLPLKLYQVINKFKSEKNKNQTMEEWVEKIDEKEFAEKYLYNFVASSWGVDVEDAKKYLIGYAMNYFAVGNTFIEIVGGLSRYVNLMKAIIQNKCDIKLGTEVKTITEIDGKYVINDQYGDFDHVVVCTNAEIASTFVSGEILPFISSVRYYDTKIVFEERNDLKYAVVNMIFDGKTTRTTAIKTWNSNIAKRWLRPDETETTGLATVQYRHPHMDMNYYIAQEKLKMHNNAKEQNFFFGSILAGFDDSHESGIRTSVNIAKKLFKRYGIDSEEIRIFVDEKCFCFC